VVCLLCSGDACDAVLVGVVIIACGVVFACVDGFVYNIGLFAVL
jgi:hypothetical protein